LNDLTHVDLFSGIGGFALAAGWAGFRTVAFVEIDKFCQDVLRKHWPDIPIHDDIRAFKWTGERPTLITGGFPCQDISVGNTDGKGIYGERSGLWTELCRIIGETRPRYALMENVANLLTRGLGGVLWDLAEIGYDAEWHCIPAAHIGAPHNRDRIWIVAHPGSQHGWERVSESVQNNLWDFHSPCYRERLRKSLFWDKEITPDYTGVVDGLPNRVDRLKSLGNSIVPQVAYQIIKGIADIERKIA
jgi:DNA (cytosine-5)-methyltransferase 1